MNFGEHEAVAQERNTPLSQQESRVLSGIASPSQSPSKEKGDHLSERDGWWMEAFRETPFPGTYNVRDFIQEADLNPVRQTYSFKGEGRKKCPNVGRTGEYLLPGCYNVIESIQVIEKKPNTYSFKNTPRTNILLGVRDKDINIAPWQYEVVTPPVTTSPSKHFMFRSAVKRFPTTHFVPKEGPGPGDYEVKRAERRCVISSCFKSTVPRFKELRSKTPGPGTYEPTRYLPKQPATLAKMGRSHNIFFRTSFDP
ncbi:protein STPG4 [Ambystoma mexicanum]|uniref:protein STPG4 n=1 Tax=Ambystoma mexicanum TaxID=8296 RepID=UPI0037E98ED7